MISVSFRMVSVLSRMVSVSLRMMSVLIKIVSVSFGMVSVSFWMVSVLIKMISVSFRMISVLIKMISVSFKMVSVLSRMVSVLVRGSIQKSVSLLFLGGGTVVETQCIASLRRTSTVGVLTQQVATRWRTTLKTKNVEPQDMGTINHRYQKRGTA